MLPQLRQLLGTWNQVQSLTSAPGNSFAEKNWILVLQKNSQAWHSCMGPLMRCRQTVPEETSGCRSCTSPARIWEDLCLQPLCWFFGCFHPGEGMLQCTFSKQHKDFSFHSSASSLQSGTPFSQSR